MIVVVCKFIFIQNYYGISLCPFIVVKNKSLKNDMVFMNHEKIHLRQQLELLVLPFYIWYLSEYFVKLIKYKNHHKAYCDISFEKEAYYHENNLAYLKKRKFWAFLKHL